MSDNRYMDFSEGLNKAWLTSVKFVRGDNEKPRNKISLTFAEKSTAESFTAPFTKQDVQLPLSSDVTQAKIGMEQRVKSVLFPLAGFEPSRKCSIRELYDALVANTTNHDIQCEISVSRTEGKSTDKNGNPIFFTNLLACTPVGFQDKKPYETDVDYDMDVGEPF